MKRFKVNLTQQEINEIVNRHSGTQEIYLDRKVLHNESVSVSLSAIDNENYGHIYQITNNHCVEWPRRPHTKSGKYKNLPDGSYIYRASEFDTVLDLLNYTNASSVLVETLKKAREQAQVVQ